MKKVLVLAALIIFLVACAPTQKPVQPVVAPLQPEYQPPTQPQPVQPPPVQASPQSAAAPPAMSVQQFTIEADDKGFYPAGDITVKKGDNVKLTFTVRTSNVYYGGLEMKSDGGPIFDTGAIKPGQSSTVEFVADKTFTYSSWWPALARKKQTATVTVT